MSTLRDCETPTAADARGAVHDLNRQYIDAARTGDAGWFDRHMAADVVIIQGSGRRVDKAEFLRLMRDEPRSFRSLTVRGATVRAFGTTVQVDADAPWELGDGQRGISRYIDTYAWLDCRWQVISAQVTLMPPSID